MKIGLTGVEHYLRTQNEMGPELKVYSSFKDTNITMMYRIAEV